MNLKRVALPYRFDHCAQQFDVASQQIIAVPLQQVDGEKVSSAWMPGTTIIRHGGSIAEETIRRNARWLLRGRANAGFTGVKCSRFCISKTKVNCELKSHSYWVDDVIIKKEEGSN